jgi:hypothetical protein
MRAKRMLFGVFLVGMATIAVTTDAASARPAEPSPSRMPSYAEAVSSPDWVKTPFGLSHKTCTHEVARGGSVDRNGNIVVGRATTVVPRCAYGTIKKPSTAVQAPTTNGWLKASAWSAPSWFRRLYSDLAVPSAPSVNGALNYFFSAFEPADMTDIIQPVLQWGSNGAFGGNFYTVASWYVIGDGRMFYSSPFTTTPGHTIYGQMEANTCSSTGANCHWAIVATDTTSDKQTRLDVTAGKSYRLAFGGAFESYGASGCNMLPANGAARFTNIKIWGPTFNLLTPQFAEWTWDQQCSMYTTMSSTSTTFGWTP